MNSNHLPERSFAAQKQWSDCLPAPSTNSITKILCRGSVPASRVWLPFPSSLSCSQSADSEGADSFRKWHMKLKTNTITQTGLKHHSWCLKRTEVGYPRLFSPFLYSAEHLCLLLKELFNDIYFKNSRWNL